MPYSPNIPQPNNKLRVSQNDLLNNFQAIGSGFAFNHVDLNLAGAGKHNLLTMPRQAFPQPTVNNLGTDLLFYVGLNATTTLSELYFKRDTDLATPGIPVTAKVVPSGAAKGWTYLPSGVLIQWGQAQSLANSFVNIDFVALGGIAYSTSGSATGNYVVLLTERRSSSNVFTIQSDKLNEHAFSVAVQNISGPAGNTVLFNWMTIGV